MALLKRSRDARQAARACGAQNVVNKKDRPKAVPGAAYPWLNREGD